ncbi:MBL fold metallo-hydrolase [Bradyrhizobium sp. Ash2021]|jgi:7,8-dihydropterin-6-yl-methyl-4-(beta-D-ribofuranosyl)aminobenzene 5'-phosphate synthase|uniref:MBL fold metallo-hydrolase n=1 Tax=Bradyrhizobium sp. Ash2021 TaxID=2954771 RepID=UPI0028155C47|nr:MBL fold metallo-hydrolase [Bradyrhizobium sp. Ash2021]WMT73327.1 MBL fold metallo-hydrolase [Bradyrhizobium sp. Ash2021]
MPKIEPADKVDIRILVDNATDMLSSNPPFVESEGASLVRRGFKLNAYKCLCCAVHGLSCLLTVHRGSESHTVLFDTGPEDYAFERNVTRLGVDLGAVESIVLSHGHADHAGAMLLALGMIRGRNGGRDVPFYAHPGMFMTRGVRQPSGKVRQMEDVPSLTDLTDFGAAMVVTTEPQVFHEGLCYVSGEIPRVTDFERGFPGQMRRTAAGWEPDELLVDERWLAVNVAGKGLVVLSACSHAGIVNVCKNARAVFPETPIHAVLGGLHLSGPNEAVIAQTVEGLKEFNLKTIAAGHCTGWRAMAALANAFPDALSPTAVGKQFTF